MFLLNFEVFKLLQFLTCRSFLMEQVLLKCDEKPNKKKDENIGVEDYLNPSFVMTFKE